MHNYKKKSLGTEELLLSERERQMSCYFFFRSFDK